MRQDVLKDMVGISGYAQLLGGFTVVMILWLFVGYPSIFHSRRIDLLQSRR